MVRRRSMYSLPLVFLDLEASLIFWSNYLHTALSLFVCNTFARTTRQQRQRRHICTHHSNRITWNCICFSFSLSYFEFPRMPTTTITLVEDEGFTYSRLSQLK
ncbi:hypothetical protein GGR55DRAFT_436465 [Xylaria sp. FL0064]|nr:hypothetical protein GGR55DRAFT_436465 [Xylaria sp. FL0064]